ncbi:MAG: hypothetical protein JWM41_2011 [Gemmatimonadetes bacterium]|nr:hypothetical protein [Gemmatimonadota bacterium]
MADDRGPPRFGRAILLAPLAAPLAVLLGSAVRAFVTTRAAPDGVNPVVGVVFLAGLLLVFGSPLSYGATLLVLWPIGAVLRDAEAFSWWALTLVGLASGGLLFPLYMHALDPRGTWDFFPGVGPAAGAATGWAFWYIASRRVSGDATA